MNLLVLFICLNIVNVILQTVKQLVTVKCGKGVAAIVNAVAFGLYTVVTVYTLCDLPLFVKAGVVAVCNLVGVYVVKWIEEKGRKDKLWLVKMTIPHMTFDKVHDVLNFHDIPHTYYDLDRYVVIDTYCDTQEQTKRVLDLAKAVGGKTFATENKLY
jgi:uncharacterized protein YebE (UPF0316 family)